MEDGAIVISTCAHDGCPYLAEAYAMSPAGSGQDEASGTAFGIRFLLVYHEGRAVEVGGREDAAYLQFLAYHGPMTGAHHFQLPEASAGATGPRYEVDDFAIVLALAATHQV